MRLTRINHAMRSVKQAGQSVGADALIRMAGFSPPTLHAVGARAVNTWSRKLFNVIVTNVPGPQLPLYAAGARMREVFPVVPLAKGQALAVGLTSYNGGVYYGLNADRAAMGDVDVIGGMLVESLAELSQLAAAEPTAEPAEPVVDGVPEPTGPAAEAADADDATTRTTNRRWRPDEGLSRGDRDHAARAAGPRQRSGNRRRRRSPSRPRSPSGTPRAMPTSWSTRPCSPPPAVRCG